MPALPSKQQPGRLVVDLSSLLHAFIARATPDILLLFGAALRTGFDSSEAHVDLCEEIVIKHIVPEFLAAVGDRVLKHHRITFVIEAGSAASFWKAGVFRTLPKGYAEAVARAEQWIMTGIGGLQIWQLRLLL